MKKTTRLATQKNLEDRTFVEQMLQHEESFRRGQQAQQQVNAQEDKRKQDETRSN